MNNIPKHLREYRVKLFPAEDAPPPAKYPDNIGYRTKFGGKPEHIQPAGDRNCGVCGQVLHFVGQIDSFENDHPDPQFMFGDVGMIYVWFCFHCGEPCASLEFY
jgi:hypothetical protein